MFFWLLGLRRRGLQLFSLAISPFSSSFTKEWCWFTLVLLSYYLSCRNEFTFRFQFPSKQSAVELDSLTNSQTQLPPDNLEQQQKQSLHLKQSANPQTIPNGTQPKQPQPRRKQTSIILLFLSHPFDNPSPNSIVFATKGHINSCVPFSSSSFNQSQPFSPFLLPWIPHALKINKKLPAHPTPSKKEKKRKNRVKTEEKTKYSQISIFNKTKASFHTGEKCCAAHSVMMEGMIEGTAAAKRQSPLISFFLHRKVDFSAFHPYGMKLTGFVGNENLRSTVSVPSISVFFAIFFRIRFPYLFFAYTVHCFLYPRYRIFCACTTNQIDESFLPLFSCHLFFRFVCVRSTHCNAVPSTHHTQTTASRVPESRVKSKYLWKAESSHPILNSPRILASIHGIFRRVVTVYLDNVE